jgi:hypothetical protein
MEITAQDAFKLGFMARCAEEQLTGPALEERLEKMATFSEKTAADLAKWSPIDVNALIGSGADKIVKGLQMVHSVPIAASIIGGSALGYGLGRAVEPPIHEDEIRAKELADTYKLYADKAKARRKLRKYRAGESEL